MRNITNVSANEVKNTPIATSAAPTNEICRKVNLLKTGPFANPTRHVSAWFILIIVVIWAEEMPSCDKRPRKIKPNCCTTG